VSSFPSSNETCAAEAIWPQYRHSGAFMANEEHLRILRPWALAASVRRTRHVGDFRRWKDHDEYQKSLARLIRDLQSDAAASH